MTPQPPPSTGPAGGNTSPSHQQGPGPTVEGMMTLQLNNQVEMPAIGLGVLSRPRRLAINEILLRPAGQA